MKAYFQIQISEPNGKCIRKTRRLRSHSFVLQYLQLLYLQMANGNTSVTLTSGIGQNTSAYVSNFLATSPGGVATRGIVVGSGITPPTPGDYALQTLILNGTTPGTLQYGIQNVGAPAIFGPNVEMQLQRSFVNATASAITIRELGVYGYAQVTPCCLIRDVLPTPITAPAGKTTTITYTLRTTV